MSFIVQIKSNWGCLLRPWLTLGCLTAVFTLFNSSPAQTATPSVYINEILASNVVTHIDTDYYIFLIGLSFTTPKAVP